MFFMRNPHLLGFLCLLCITWPTKAQHFDIIGQDQLKGRVRQIQTEQKTYQELNGKEIHAEEWQLYSQVNYDKKQGVTGEKRYYVRCGNGDDNERTRKKISTDDQLIELIYGKTQMLEEKVIHTKGKDGKLLTSNYYDANGKLRHQWLYSYEVDHQGNWIRREASLKIPDGYQLKLMERRTITYYPSKIGARSKLR
jgi:hypothetical protein